jgi:hypothetical protein
MDTEKSVVPELARFTARVTERLVEGERVFGNVSLTRPAASLLDEIQQELEDVAGWGALLWVRLERLREKARTQTEL